MRNKKALIQGSRLRNLTVQAILRIC